MTVTQNGAVTAKSLRTTSAGVATWAFPARASGTVAAAAADPAAGASCLVPRASPSLMSPLFVVD